VFGVVEGEVGEQRVDRCEPVVPCSWCVVPFGLQVPEERCDKRRVEIVDVELAGVMSRSVEKRTGGAARRWSCRSRWCSGWQRVGRSAGR
jgi:hypothetical protein